MLLLHENIQNWFLVFYNSLHIFGFTVFSVDPKYFEKNAMPNFFLECTPIIFFGFFVSRTNNYLSIDKLWWYNIKVHYWLSSLYYPSIDFCRYGMVQEVHCTKFSRNDYTINNCFQTSKTLFFLNTEWETCSKKYNFWRTRDRGTWSQLSLRAI